MDVSKKNRAPRPREILEKELRVIKKVNQAISLTPDVEAVAGAVLDIVLTETIAQNASIMMPSADRTHLEIRAAKGVQDRHCHYSEESLGQTFPMGEGISGMVALTREAVIIQNTVSDPLFQARAMRVKVGSLLSMPLIYGRSELVGVINLSHAEPEAFTPDDLHLIEALLPSAALALRNARLMRDIEDINRMLKVELSMTDRALEDFGKNILKVFNYMSIGVLTVDPSGEITTINNKAIGLLHLGTGASLAPIVGEEVMASFDREMPEIWRDVELDGHVLHMEFSPLPVTSSLQILLCLRDVTLDRFKERELVRVKDQYKDMVEKAIDAIYIIKNGRFLLINKKFQEMLGYAQEDLLGVHFRHFITRDSLNSLGEALRPTTGNTFIPHLELQAIKKDGQILSLEISIGRLKLEDALCFVGVVRDITSKKELLSIKTRFLHVASHEIRVPLTVIRGYARMLSRDRECALSDEKRECITEIEKQCERLLHFSNTLLDFSRINAGGLNLHRQSVDLYRQIQHVVRTMQIKASDFGVTIAFEGDPTIPELSIDPIKIEQALYNLIDNALKHSPRPGVVTIALSMGLSEDDALNRILNQESAIITVHDQGPGIRPEEARELFGEFFVGESGRAKGGFGLGLAITKEIIHAHGGRVEARPSSAGGHFIVTIPLNRQDDSCILDH